MIDKKDIILLLNDIQTSDGIDMSAEIMKTLSADSIPLDVLKIINERRQLDVTKFYEKLRASYNKKRSKLYINIMRADENVLDNPKTILTTLSALLNQILQYDADDRPMFYQHSRADEISKVLALYFKNYNLDDALRLLELTKADIKVLEILNNKNQ